MYFFCKNPRLPMYLLIFCICYKHVVLFYVIQYIVLYQQPYYPTYMERQINVSLPNLAILNQPVWLCPVSLNIAHGAVIWHRHYGNEHFALYLLLKYTMSVQNTFTSIGYPYPHADTFVADDIWKHCGKGLKYYVNLKKNTLYEMR